MGALKHQVIAQLEATTGRRITYQSISPSIFHFLEIRGLEVFDPGRSVPLLQIRRIEVSYNIWTLITGQPAASLNEISIENSSLHVDTTNDADLVRFLRDLTKGGGGSSGVASLGAITLAGKNLSVSVSGPDGVVSVNRLFFQVRNAGSGVAVQLRGGLDLSLTKGPLGLKRLATAVQVSGSLGPQFTWSDLRVRFNNLSSNLVNLARPVFHLTLRQGVWELRKIQDNAPIDLLASYNQHEQRLKVSFVADGFRPNDYLTFGSHLERYDSWLSGVLSGKGEASYSLATHAFSYSGSVDLQLSNRPLPFPVSASMAVSGNDRTASFSRLSLRSRYGSVAFTGNVDLKNLLPQGNLRASDIYTPLGPRLSADFSLRRSGDSVTARSQTVVIGTNILYGLELRLQPSRSSVKFGVGLSFAQDHTQLSASGTAYLGGSPYVAVSGSLDQLPLDSLYELLDRHPLPGVLDTLKGLSATSKLFVTTNLKRVSFASPQLVISDNLAKPERRISVRVAGNSRSLRLQNLSVAWRQYHVAGSLSAEYVESNRIQLTTTIQAEQSSYSLTGFYQIGDNLILSGNHGIDLAAVRQGGSYVFSLKTDKLPIPFRGVTSQATLDLEGVYTNPSKWEVVSRDSRFADLPFLRTKANSLRVSARLSATGGDIYSLEYADSISHLSGNGKLSLSPGRPGVTGNGWVQLVGTDQKESYSANFSFAPGSIDASVDFAQAPLARLGKLPVSGLVSGSVSITGRPTSPDLAVRLSLPDGQIYTDPITADIAFTASNSKVTISSLSARYLASSIDGASGSLDFHSGAFQLSGNYRGDLNGDLISAHLGISGQATPIAHRRELDRLLAGDLTATADVSAITVENTPAPSWKVGITKRQDRVVFSGGPADGVSGYILNSGKFYVHLAAPLPITLQADGQISGSKISASLQNVGLDLRAFDSVAKIPYFDISRGTARGNLEITGSINDPDFQGDLVATNVYGKTPVLSNEIGPFNTNLVFQGKSLSMSDVAIRAGNSQVLGNLNFVLDHWIPTKYDLTFATQSAQGVHVKYTVSGIDFDGYANGSVSIKGDSAGTEISGNLDISSCLITIGSTTQPRSSNGSGGSAPASDVNYNFTFTTGKQVQFAWPNNNVPILRAFADTGQKLKVVSTGSTGAFSITGTINVKGGEVFYLRQNFYLRQGSIAFNEDQNKVDPIVNLRAELREINDKGKPVSIFLVVNHKPLSQFAPSFESNPPMPNSEILALLGQDIYAQLGGQQLNLTSAMLFTGDLLSQFSVLRTFEDKVKQAFNLDLFSVRTDLLQNIVRDKFLGQGPTTTSPGSSLGQYLDNTTFFLGKYFGNDLFLEAMINLRSNNAFLSQFGNSGNLQVDSEILFEWKTPLFLLQLSFLPNPADLLSSLTNTTLSLSWGFSF